MEKIKPLVFVSSFIIVLGGAWLLYQRSLIHPEYLGLPTVPCIDTTQPILQDFVFTIEISVQGNLYPIDTNIGHSAGNCLHEMHVNDNSGIVYIISNHSDDFVLGQFFDLWHKTFTDSQLFENIVTEGHSLKVYVNDNPVDTFRNTVIHADDHIKIDYQ